MGPLPAVKLLPLLLLLACSSAAGQAFQKSASKDVAVDYSVNFDHEGLIRIQDGKFVDENCREYHFSGWNAWGIVDTAAFILQVPDDVTAVQEGKNPIIWMLDEAVKAGLGVMRIFGHSVVKGLPLQTEPGIYDERIFQGLDYVIHEAGLRGIKLIISFSTNWKKIDGKDQFLAWVPEIESQDEFWINSKTKQLYKDHMEAIALRTNTFSGIDYKDDPAIFAWNLFNELRCLSPFCFQDEQVSTEWYREMSAFLKSADPNHLITTGQEGFYGWGCPTRGIKSPLGYVHERGQDFIRDHSVPDIDFAVAHLWPNNWGVAEDLDFPIDWIRKHSQDSEDFIKKPLVVEEFGIVTDGSDEERKEIRDPFFAKILKEVDDEVDKGGVLKAAMFWEWHIRLEKDPSEHGVVVGDSTWEIILEHTKKVAERNTGPPIKACVPGTETQRQESIDPDNRLDLNACCDEDCQAMWADLKGDITQESITASASDCCRACKFANIRSGTFVCTNWSWCACGDCEGSKKGTCRLKTKQHPFYVEPYVSGRTQHWVSGVAGKFVTDSVCQPSGACAFSPECKDFSESLKCADPTCGASRFNLNRHFNENELIELSVNARIKRKYDEKRPPPVTTAAECCAECRKTDGCTGWRFCHRKDGCYIIGESCEKEREGLGMSKYEPCQGDSYPHLMCTLYQNVDIKLVKPRYREDSQFISGFLK